MLYSKLAHDKLLMDSDFTGSCSTDIIYVVCWVKYIEVNQLFLFKIMIGKFQDGFFDKRDSFHFSIVRMPGKSINVPYNISHSASGAKS